MGMAAVRVRATGGADGDSCCPGAPTAAGGMYCPTAAGSTNCGGVPDDKVAVRMTAGCGAEGWYRCSSGSSCAVGGGGDTPRTWPMADRRAKFISSNCSSDSPALGIIPVIAEYSRLASIYVATAVAAIGAVLPAAAGMALGAVEGCILARRPPKNPGPEPAS